MAFAAALGSMIGSGSEGAASAAQYQASKHERNIAWKRQQQWELIAPSLRVGGLRAAGLNPILAATQGMTGGPGHVGMASPGSLPSFDKDSVGRAISSAKQAKSMSSQVEILRQQMLQEQEKTRQQVIATGVAEKYSEARNRAETMAAQESVLNLVAQRGLTAAHTQEAEQAKQRIYMDRLLMEMGVPGARAIEELYDKHPWLRQVREFSGGSLGGSAVGAGSAAAGYLFGRGSRKGVKPGRKK